MLPPNLPIHKGAKNRFMRFLTPLCFFLPVLNQSLGAAGLIGVCQVLAPTVFTLRL